MFEYMENLKIVSSFRNESKLTGRIQSRLTHGFIFKIKGTATYYFDDRTLTLRAGEVVFLPKGGFYHYTTLPTDGNLYTSINFHADMQDPVAAVYDLSDFHSMQYIHDSFTQLWNFGTASDHYQCLATFWDLVAYIARIEHINSAKSDKYRMIRPGVTYLNEHLYDADFRVDKLHRLCGVSDTYFRRLFAEKFHMSPQAYVGTRRLAHARSILESGDYDSIREVAKTVGYRDPLYFSRAFHSLYGFAPSDIYK